MELISREAAIEALKRAEALTRAFGYHNVIDTIREQPTIDPVKRGKWIGSDDFDEYYRCSECGKGETQFGGLYHYCPNCGARMEGEEDE